MEWDKTEKIRTLCLHCGHKTPTCFTDEEASTRQFKCDACGKFSNYTRVGNTRRAANMKHTKGPWRMGTMRDTGVAILKDNGCLIIAQVVNEPDQSMMEAAVADARLITRAPNLLEVCMDVLALLEDSSFTTDKEDKAREILKIEINKATGGQRGC